MSTSSRYPAVIFICTANLCRSPLAEAIFKNVLHDLGPTWEKWRVESAGTWATPNQPPLPETINTAQKMGLDIAHHRSRRVSRELLEEFDLVLTMGSNHKEALQTEFPELAARIFLLSEMTGKKQTIVDPVGEAESEYLHTGLEIAQYIRKGLRQIVALATRPL